MVALQIHSFPAICLFIPARVAGSRDYVPRTEATNKRNPVYWNGILPVPIVVAAKMQTDPARELAVLTSSSYTDGSSRRGLARCANEEREGEKKGAARGWDERGTKDEYQKSVKTRRTTSRRDTPARI